MYIYHHKMVGSIPIILNMRHFMGRYIMRPPSGDGAFGVSAAFAASISLEPRWREGSRPICRCPYTKIEKDNCRFTGIDISIPSRCVSISAKVIVLGDSNHWFSHFDNHQFQMIFWGPSFSETSINQTIVEITKDMS